MIIDACVTASLNLGANLDCQRSFFGGVGEGGETTKSGHVAFIQVWPFRFF